MSVQASSAIRRLTPVPSGVRVAVVMIVGFAWVLTLIGAAWGAASTLHHHALIKGGPPLWIGIPIFLTAWLVMVAAMMLPSSVPAIKTMVGLHTARGRGHPIKALASFLAA